MSPDEQVDEILDRPGENAEIRCLALIHGCACSDRFDLVEVLVARALERGLPLPRLEEAALQVVAYAGYPRALNALKILAAARPGGAAIEADTPDDRERAGRRVWESVYGDRAEKVAGTLEGFIPGLSRWVIEDAYGRILSRPGLTLAERELLAVSALALMAQAAPLDSHLRGALRNGSSRSDVEDILRCSRPLASPAARDVVDRALARLSRKVYEA